MVNESLAACMYLEVRRGRGTVSQRLSGKVANVCRHVTSRTNLHTDGRFSEHRVVIIRIENKRLYVISYRKKSTLHILFVCEYIILIL